MRQGFSLLECLIALTISTAIALGLFELFGRNERVFREQGAALELAQAARMAAFQIADELRLAGQGVPVFNATFDAVASEDAAVILSGSGASRIQFRAGVSNVEAEALSPALQLTSGLPTTLSVSNPAIFGGLVNRHVYVSGPVGNGVWGWARAVLGPGMQATPLQTIQFSGYSRVSLDEAIAIYRDPATNSIRRTTAVDLTSSSTVLWAPANELASSVTALNFAYFDEAGGPVLPDTLTNRNRITRIGVALTIRAAGIPGALPRDFSISLITNLRRQGR